MNGAKEQEENGKKYETIQLSGIPKSYFNIQYRQNHG